MFKLGHKTSEETRRRYNDKARITTVIHPDLRRVRNDEIQRTAEDLCPVV